MGEAEQMKRLHSIFTDDLEHCMFTDSNVVERHHCFGAALRSKSEKYGFRAPLHPTLHPNGVHFNPTPDNKKIDRYLKEQCQKWYEENIGTREQWLAEFYRNYL